VVATDGEGNGVFAAAGFFSLAATAAASATYLSAAATRQSREVFGPFLF